MPADVEKIKEKVRKRLMEEFGVSPRVKVLAFGGGAGRIAQYIASRKIAGVKTIAVNADQKVAELKVDKVMRLGKEVLGTHSDTNGEPKVAEYIVDRSKSWILEEARDADAIVVLAALGGGMGSGGAVEVMRILKRKTKKPMLAIFVLPFSVEKERRARAMEVLKTVEDKDLGTYIVFDSDDMLRKYPNLPLNRGYHKMYDKIAKTVSRLSESTGRIIEKKFNEIFLEHFDEIVEEEYEKSLAEPEIYS